MFSFNTVLCSCAVFELVIFFATVYRCYPFHTFSIAIIISIPNTFTITNYFTITVAATFLLRLLLPVLFLVFTGT